MTAVAGRRMAETVARRGGLAVHPAGHPDRRRRRGRRLGEAAAPGASTPRSRSRPHQTVGDALALLPKRAHGAAVVVDDGRPVGVVTEADCTGVDRFTQVARRDVHASWSRCRDGVDPRDGVRRR